MKSAVLQVCDTLWYNFLLSKKFLEIFLLMENELYCESDIRFAAGLCDGLGKVERCGGGGGLGGAPWLLILTRAVERFGDLAGGICVCVCVFVCVCVCV